MSICEECGGEEEDLSKRGLCESCEEVAGPAPGTECDICTNPAVTEIGGHYRCEDHDDE